MSCPIDRYMVDGSRGIEMVDILKDESWTVEPTLRPEDELVLRKLRDLLQSTADDLKDLSTELTAVRELSSQPKAPTMPLDEEFNQKSHIEQMVNLKFQGHSVGTDRGSMYVKTETQNFDIERKKCISTGVQVELEKNVTVLPKTRTNGRTVKASQIRMQESTIPKEEEKGTCKSQGFHSENKSSEHYTKTNEHIKPHKVPSYSVAYSEMSHVYMEQENKKTPRKGLQVQCMPSICIRGELKKQEVLHLDILPRDICVKKQSMSKNNTAVIEIQHNVKSPMAVTTKPRKDKLIQTEVFSEESQSVTQNFPTSRKVLKLSTYESSDYNSSDARNRVSKPKKNSKDAYVTSSHSTSFKVRNISSTKLQNNKSQCVSIDDWKKKLDTVYGQPSTSKQALFSTKSKKKINVKNILPKKCNISNISAKNKTTKLNNTEYVPYSKLTLGGVKLSDIEREIPDVRRKADESLAPVLDKILNERKITSQETENITSKVLTTSDESLLREVVEIEKNVNRLIDKDFIEIFKDVSNNSNAGSGRNNNNNLNKSSSYDDDFEEVEQTTEFSSSAEKEENSNKLNSERSKTHNKANRDFNFSGEKRFQCENDKKENSDIEDSLNHVHQNKTGNLSFKNSVDIFEFIHSVDTQDMGTQSNTMQQLLLKETQTSPRQENAITVTKINPIHNDLWQSAIDKREIEKMFKLEKEFIRQLIIDEYSDLVEKDITKPSTSNYAKEKEENKNIAIVQKNTQTSPAHVKSVMTSPRKTKTRTTSPISLISQIPRYTRPLDDVAKHYESSHKLSEQSQSNHVDLGISINLSSPRFNLKLPQSSQEVLTNLEFSGHSQKEKLHKMAATVNNTINSSSSIDADRSDSESSSLGEIKFRLRRKYLNDQSTKLSSDSSSTSTVSKSTSEIQSAIGRLKSEGEINMGYF